MSSAYPSLHTDLELYENLSLSNLSLSLESIDDEVRLDEIHKSFPSITFSIASSTDRSNEVSFVKTKNAEIYETIKFKISKLKKASKDALIDRVKDIYIENKRPPSENTYKTENLQTKDTENNVEILHEILGNIRILNENLKITKKNLKNDLTDIEELEKEHLELKTKLDLIASKITFSLSMEADEKIDASSSCKCSIV
jgi:hypothetical protein